MTGDQDDMVSRLRELLPARWFPDTAPVLDAVLTGFAAVWAAAYEQLAFVGLQTRIATATGGFLDMIAADFFGTRLQRRPLQDDDAYRQVVGLELQRVRGTRAALQAAVEDTDRTTAGHFRACACGRYEGMGHGVRLGRGGRLGQSSDALSMPGHGISPTGGRTVWCGRLGRTRWCVGWRRDLLRKPLHDDRPGY